MTHWEAFREGEPLHGCHFLGEPGVPELLIELLALCIIEVVLSKYVFSFEGSHPSGDAELVASL